MTTAVEQERGRKAGSIEAWLLWNLPPLGGGLRLVFYAGSLLLFAFINHGLDFTGSVASPYLYEPRGLTAWLGIPYLPPDAMRSLMAATYAAWACAAVGLFTQPAKVATAIGLLLALGFEQAYTVGHNHTHYLLLYSLICLSFSTSDDAWSIDSWLRRRFGRNGANPRRPGLGATGLPRQAVLMLAVSCYFGAGISKLVDAGPIWIDGSSLQYFIGSQVDHTGFGAIRSLRIWVADQRWLCQLLSATTLLIELGAPLALVSRRIRHLYIPLWVGMHFGIVLLMIPNYWIHSWCIAVLLCDWEWLRRGWAERSWPRQSFAAETGPALAGGARVRAAVAGALLVPLALAPPPLQLEWFPLTHVPMYASYVAPGNFGGIPAEDFGDETRVRELARRCAGSRVIGYTRRCPWKTTQRLADRLVLQLRGPERGPDRFSGKLDRLRHPLADHLAATSPDPNDEAPATGLANRVRALLRAQPAGALAGYDYFSLEYSLREGAIPLVSGRFELAE